jgi:hypothetical protein
MALFDRALKMLAPSYGAEEKAKSTDAPPQAGGEDPRLKRLEAQIEQLTRQLEAMGRGSEGGEH